MDEAVAETSRAMATALAPQLGEGIGPAVEAALAEPDAAPGMYDASTLISLGGLIVSIASLAWTIYRDLKSDAGGAAPSEDAVARKLWMRPIRNDGLDKSTMDAIVTAAAREVVARGRAHPDGSP